MKKSILILMSLILTVFVLLITKAVISNNISTSGELLGQITDKTKHYKTENAIIGEELYSMLSLTNIAVKAKDQGFVEAKDCIALTNSLSIAIKQ